MSHKILPGLSAKELADDADVSARNARDGHESFYEARMAVATQLRCTAAIVAALDHLSEMIDDTGSMLLRGHND